jgi:C1A family cysteine protease
MTNDGVAHESLWPYDIGQFDAEPPSSVVADAAKAKSTSTSTVSGATNDIKAALNIPAPVIFSFEVYANYESVGSDGLIPMPGGGDVGGHANVVVGYSDATTNTDGSKGAFLVRNSWGTSWGMAGYGWMPYAFADQGLMQNPYVVKAESEISVTPSKCPDGSTPTTCPDGTTVCPPATCGGGGGGGGANLNIAVNVREHQPGRE